MSEAGRGVLTGFGTASLAKVECLELGLGLFWVVFGDVARAEAIAALYEAMIFVVAQGARRGGLLRQVCDFPTWWGPRGREGREARRGHRSWLGLRSLGGGGFYDRGHVHVCLVRDGCRCAGVGGALNLYSLQDEGGEEGDGKGELFLDWSIPVPEALDDEYVEEDGGQLDAARQEEVVDVADAQLSLF